MVQVVAKRQNRNAHDCPENLGRSVGNGKGTGHHANTQSADCGWHHKAVIPQTLTQSEDAEENSKEKAGFMDNRIE